MRTLSLKIPETLDGHIAALAEHKGISKSELIRTALLEMLNKERGTNNRGSALALVEDLVGSVEGPEDLSYNPAYLDDLGR